MMLKNTMNIANAVKLNIPIQVKMAVKANVDKPMMSANVPIMDNLSFHALISSPSSLNEKEFINLALKGFRTTWKTLD